MAILGKFSLTSRKLSRGTGLSLVMLYSTLSALIGICRPLAGVFCSYLGGGRGQMIQQCGGVLGLATVTLEWSTQIRGE